MRFPIDNPYKITTHFNKVTHPGLDLAPIPAGSGGVAFHAPERSKVIEVGYRPNLEGNYIKLQGDSGMYYYGGHFDKVFVITGTIVNEGEVLATLGMTGNADGIHVHFECRKTSTGSQVDPLTIKWEEGDDMTISNENEAHYLTRLGTFVEPRDNSFTKTLVGLDLTSAIRKIEALGERRTATERFNAYDELKAEIKRLEDGFEPVEEKLYRRK